MTIQLLRGCFCAQWLKSCCAALALILSVSLPALADAQRDYSAIIELYQQKRWNLAIQSCDAFLRDHPDNDRANWVKLFRGQAFVHLRDFSAARDQFRTFLETVPEHPDRAFATYRVAECSFFLHDYHQAVIEFQTYLDRYPEHALAEWAQVSLGESLLTLNDATAAERVFQEAITKFPEGSLIGQAEYGLAVINEQRGQLEEALALYRRAAERSQNVRAAQAQFRLATLDFQNGDYSAAIASFQKVLEKNPAPALAAQAELNIGYALYHQKKFEEAITHFEKAALVPTQQSVAGLWTGLSYQSLENHTKAAETFASVFEKHPDTPESERLLFHWGDAEFRLGNDEQAIKLFDRAFREFPRGDLADDALHLATRAALQAENLTLALEYYEKLTNFFPNSGLRLVHELQHGQILIAQGDREEEPQSSELYDRAIGVLEEVYKTSQHIETKSVAKYHQARAYERLARDNNALTALQLAAEGESSLTPEQQANLIHLRAQIYLRLKQYSLAIADFQSLSLDSLSEQNRFGILSGLTTAAIAIRDWDLVEKTLQTSKAQTNQPSRWSAIALVAGDSAADANAWDYAEKFYQQILLSETTTPENLMALSGIAHAQYEQGKYLAAVSAFDRLEKAATTDLLTRSHAVYLQGMSQHLSGQNEEALATFERGLQTFSQVLIPESQSNHSVGWNAYRSAKEGARCARELTQTDRAERLYDAAYREIKHQPENAQVELDLLINEWADMHYNQRNFQRSDELYSLLITERPQSPLVGNARLVLAESSRFSGQHDKAINAFETLADDPQLDQFIQQRALVHLVDLSAENEDWDDVLAYSQRLAERNSVTHNDYATYRQGEAYLHQQKLAQAAEVLTDLKDRLNANWETAPSWSLQTWLLLATAAQALSDDELLTTVLTEFREKNPPTDLRQQADLIEGQSLERQMQHAEARALYRKIIEADEQKRSEAAAEAQLRIANSELIEKDLQTAIEEFEKVTNLYDIPQFEAIAQYQIGECKLALKDFTGALTAYESFLKEYPDHDLTTQARNRVEITQKQIDSAKAQEQVEQPQPQTTAPQPTTETPEPIPQPAADTPLQPELSEESPTTSEEKPAPADETPLPSEPTPTPTPEPVTPTPVPVTPTPTPTPEPEPTLDDPQPQPQEQPRTPTPTPTPSAGSEEPEAGDAAT